MQALHDIIEERNHSEVLNMPTDVMRAIDAFNKGDHPYEAYVTVYNTFAGFHYDVAIVVVDDYRNKIVKEQTHLTEADLIEFLAGEVYTD